MVHPAAQHHHAAPSASTRDVEVDSSSCSPYRGDRSCCAATVSSTRSPTTRSRSIAASTGRPGRGGQGAGAPGQRQRRPRQHHRRRRRRPWTTTAGPSEPRRRSKRSGSGTGEHTAVIGQEVGRVRRGRARGQRASDPPAEPRPRRFTWRVVVVPRARHRRVRVAPVPRSTGTPATPTTSASREAGGDLPGRPGGLLWFDPTLEKRTPLTADEVLPGIVRRAPRRQEASVAGRRRPLRATTSSTDDATGHARRRPRRRTTTRSPGRRPTTDADRCGRSRRNTELGLILLAAVDHHRRLHAGQPRPHRRRLPADIGAVPRRRRSAVGRRPRRRPPARARRRRILLPLAGAAERHRLRVHRPARRTTSPRLQAIVDRGRHRAPSSPRCCSCAGSATSSATATRSRSLGIGLLLLLPSSRVIGQNINGARIWVAVSGRSTSSPASSPRSCWPSSSRPISSRSASCSRTARRASGPARCARPQAPRPAAAGLGVSRSSS